MSNKSKPSSSKMSRRSDISRSIAQKIQLASGALDSIERELKSANPPQTFSTLIEHKPLSQERLDQLLRDYTVLAARNQFLSKLFCELERLSSQLQVAEKSAAKGGRPIKNETEIGVELALSYYKRHGKHMTGEQLSRKVSQKILGDHCWEDEHGRRPLSLSGSRNCIKQAKEILDITNNPQILLIDLLKNL